MNQASTSLVKKQDRRGTLIDDGLDEDKYNER
jgi:hypothetical protein